MSLDEKETSVMINGPVGAIEAKLTLGDVQGVFAAKQLLVVVCHPHPQHGGSMENKVVTTLMRTYRDLGIEVLCFNFRGVGKSQGVFANAVGEVDDLMAVIDWVKINRIDVGLLLAGFSFGSSIAAQASYRTAGVLHLTLIAPPVERYVYDRDKFFDMPVCVVQGDQDERVIASGVYAWLATLNSSVELIRYADAGHFFHGYLSALKTDLSEKLLVQLK